MGKHKPAVKLVWVLGGALACLTEPLRAQQNTEQQLPRVEVLGSSIKRLQMEGPAPVSSYSQRDIQRSGATTLNEWLRSVPAVDLFDQGELVPNSPSASGTAYIRMRGLSESNVLVLLNGQRLPVHALHESDGDGAAVDINMIPLSAIERIEILKDGGSAIYGADAVAGVVNLITKRSMRGMEARAAYGLSQKGDGEEKRAGFSGGFGDLHTDRYNVFFTVDVLRRDPILRRDREISRTADFRRFGGADARSSFSPAGNVLDPATLSPNGSTLQPCAPEDYNARCRYDFNRDALTAYNGAQRQSGWVIGNMKLDSDIVLSAEAMFSQAKDSFSIPPAPDIFATPGGDLFYGRFLQSGARLTDRDSSLARLSLGVEGALASGATWKVQAGQGRSRVIQRDRNYLRDCPRDSTSGILCEAGSAVGTFTGATQAGWIDPTVSTNDPALVESVKVHPQRSGVSTLSFLNGTVTGDLAQWSAGPLSYAVGASVWRESLSDRPDTLAQQGLILGAIQQAAVDARRSVAAVFGELNIPMNAQWEAQTALRIDRYAEYSAASPKLAVRYSPAQTMALRASYARSFRAPSLKQLHGGQEESSADFSDDHLCAALGLSAGCTVNGWTISGSNPALKAEKGQSWNLGLVLEPSKDFSMRLDYWRIRKRDSIMVPSNGRSIEQGLWKVDGSGRILVMTDLQNVAQTDSAGIDADFRLRAFSRIGQWNVRNVFTYYLKQRQRTFANDPWDEFNATYAKPRARNLFSLELRQGAWANTVAVRWTGGFSDTDQPNPPLGTRKVRSYEEVDWGLTYSQSPNLDLTFMVKNVFHRQPPFSQQNVINGQYSQMGFAELYNNRGRFYQVGLRYAFR